MKDGIVAQTMTSAVAALSMCVISSTAGAEDAGDATRLQPDASRFAYARLYCTPDNESHFGALTVKLEKQNFAPPAALIYIGGNQPASNVFLGGFEAHWAPPTWRTISTILLPQFSSSLWSKAYSRSRSQMARQRNCTRATWSIWKTRRPAKDTSPSRATKSDSLLFAR